MHLCWTSAEGAQHHICTECLRGQPKQTQHLCQCPARSLEGCSFATSERSASAVKLWLVYMHTSAAMVIAFSAAPHAAPVKQQKKLLSPHTQGLQPGQEASDHLYPCAD